MTSGSPPASDLLGPLLHAAAIAQRSIADVMGWLADPRSSQAASPGGKSTTAFGTALAILDGAHSHDAQIAARTLRGTTVGTASETMLSFATMARVALKVFSTRAGIQSTLQQPALDFDRLLDSDDTIYIVGTEDVQDELRPIFVGLIDALIIRVGERIQQEQRAEKPLLLLLDEAANSAPLTKLPQYAATLRSRDVQLVTIFQDYGQVVRPAQKRTGGSGWHRSMSCERSLPATPYSSTTTRCQQRFGCVPTTGNANGETSAAGSDHPHGTLLDLVF